MDGLAFYREKFSQEIEAIEWLARFAPPGAVVLEAQGDDYTDAGRVASITGLPTVLGWLSHEHQWGRDYGGLLETRADVDRIYFSEDPEEVRTLLEKYNVSYVFVGRLEAQRYGPEVTERLAQALPLVYQRGAVAIFHAFSTGSTGRG